MSDRNAFVAELLGEKSPTAENVSARMTANDR